jgi:hypothetical protein
LSPRPGMRPFLGWIALTSLSGATRRACCRPERQSHSVTLASIVAFTAALLQRKPLDSAIGSAGCRTRRRDHVTRRGGSFALCSCTPLKPRSKPATPEVRS